MGRENVALQSFNRGRISPLALARTDLKRTALSAEVQTNFMPRTLGSMMLRPGLRYLGSSRDDAEAVFIPFVFSTSDTALIEVTDGALRVWVDDEPIERPAVGTTVTNGSFDTDLTGWDSADQSGAVSAWATGGLLSLTGTEFNAAIRRQQVTVAGGDANKEHGLRIVVSRGSVTLKVGTASGTDEYLSYTITSGEHSLAFTPTGDFHIELSAVTAYASLVTSVSIDLPGTMEIPAPWPAAALGLIRYDQSADVIYLACKGYQPRKIERRSKTSWSLVLYQPTDGPFRVPNLGTTTLTPSGLTGNITLTASKDVFEAGNVGSLYRITSIGQAVSSALSGEAQFTDHVKVTGTGTQRNVQIDTTGTYTGKLTIQRSVSEPGAWVDVSTENVNTAYNDKLNGQTRYYRLSLLHSFGTVTINLKGRTAGLVSNSATATLTASGTTNYVTVTGDDDERTLLITSAGTWSGTLTLQVATSTSGPWTDVVIDPFNNPYNDALDNQIIYYRIGFKPGDYTSGTATVKMTASNGGIAGVVRVTEFVSETQVNASVLKTLGGTTGSTEWSEGLWSDRRGWPSAVTIANGRLWHAGKNRIVASVSDAYEGFDPDTEGDSGPINRTIGQGPVDDINWIIALQRIMLGTASAEVSIKSSSFDEPITPTQFSLGFPSTQGSAEIAPVKVDSTGLFVNRGGTRIMELVYNEGTYDYATGNKTILVPEIGEPGVVRLACQRQPDTRVHAVRSDGTVAVLISDAAEEVSCWIEVETDGFIEDAVVLPGSVEDAVYYLVRRTIDGQTRRYLERWAKESDCRGGELNKLADAFIEVERDISDPSDTITGLDHLEGREVVVWADGMDFSPDDPDTGVQRTYAVSSGQVTLDEQVLKAVIGLPYRARFKSTKLAYAAQAGTALNRRKKLNRLGFVLANTHALGIKYGPDFDTLDDLPLMEEGLEVGADTIHAHYDFDLMEFAGDWTTDSRLCLEARAPRPCTVLAAIVDITTNG